MRRWRDNIRSIETRKLETKNTSKLVSPLQFLLAPAGSNAVADGGRRGFDRKKP
jgi:hypothetical protein